MKPERVPGEKCGPPFPVYEDLVATLAAAEKPPAAGRDPVVAHVLGTCAGYSYSDAETVAMIMSRLGFETNACVRITQTVDAMLIFSTVYLVQSRCGRVVILCYRGTEPTNLGNWLGDADVGPETTTLGGESFRVHSGFHRNLRATRWSVLRELDLALEGRSLLDPEKRLEHPLEALYVTGHSLGGAMAVLFALSVASSERRRIAETLRAVYTFGQPMTVGEPLPKVAHDVGPRLFRHVISRDLIPTLPAASWGRFAHFGKEYRYEDGEWRESTTPVAQLENLREIPRSFVALFAPKRRRSSRYSVTEHGPHHYIAALRPEGRITEFGDRG